MTPKEVKPIQLFIAKSGVSVFYLQSQNPLWDGYFCTDKCVQPLTPLNFMQHNITPLTEKWLLDTFGLTLEEVRRLNIYRLTLKELTDGI